MRCPWDAPKNSTCRSKWGPDYRAAIGVPGGFASQYLQADEVWPSLQKLSIFLTVRVLDCCPVENAVIKRWYVSCNIIYKHTIWKMVFVRLFGSRKPSVWTWTIGEAIVFTLACSTKIMHRTLVERWWMPAKQVGGLSLLGRALVIGEGRFLQETFDGPAASVL